jgi:hypothetical protein
MLIIILSPLTLSEQAYAGSTNVVQGKAATCSNVIDSNGVDISYMLPYGPSRAVDGKTNALNRWQTRKGVDGSYLQVNLGGLYSIDHWVVYNQSYAWGNDAIYAMKAYKLQKSNDGVNFTDVDVVSGNASSVTDRAVSRFTANYLRVQVTQGCVDANSNSWDSILEFQAFGDVVALPSVTTSGVSEISDNSAVLTGTVVSDGGSEITERGFVYSLNDTPVINEDGVYSETVSGTIGEFSKIITTGLVKNTTYYYRAYAKNIMGITYGSVANFTTLDSRVDISVSAELSEGSLNGKEIIVNLTGDTFNDSTMDETNFILGNAPTGLTVGSVNYNSDTQCTITLAFDGTDFDSNISNLTLTVKGAELTSGSDLAAANNLLITANQEPTDINLSSDTIDENNPSGTTIGTFSTTDLDVGETFTYSLVSGQGDADNGAFTIQDNQLLTNQEFDYETQNSFSIRVKTTDSSGGTYEKSFTIHITDVSEIVNVTSISIKTQPTMTYNEGDSLDLGALEVTLHKSNGTTEVVAFVDFTTKGLAINKPDGTVLALSDNGTAITVTHTASGQTAQTDNLTVNDLMVNTFTVTFEDWDGSLIDTQTVNEGSAATAPADPTRTGNIFTGWDKTFNNITTDLIVTAQYIEDIPAVTDADKVAQDKAILNIGFASGDNESSVTEDITLIDTGTINGSIITWNSANTSVISNTGTVTRPEFLSGDTEVAITATVSYNGTSETKDFLLTVLKLEPIAYTVTFKDWDGTTLKTQIVNEGSPAVEPGNPTRSGYTFTGWDQAFDKLTSDLTITAKYSKNTSHGGRGSTTNNASSQQPKTETATTANRVTATTSTTATVDNSGKAAATVTPSQVNEAISKGMEAAKQGSATMATVQIKVEAAAGVKTVETSIPAAAVNAVADKKTVGLKVSTPIASIAFDRKAMDTISQAASGDVKISASTVSSTTLNQETQQIVGDRPVYNFSVTSGNDVISQFGGNVTVEAPYTPKAGEDTSAIVIYYINAQGEPELVSNCSYDATTKTIRFTTNHFSQYAVGYNEVSFRDVSSNAWYSKSVSFVAARGITTGSGEGTYNPNAKLTRGQFLVMLMRAYGISADENSKDNFSDAGNKYYTGYLAAAKSLAITAGIGNNRFAPDKEITRQEMVTLSYNILDQLGELPTTETEKTLTSYSDSNEIASWAKNAMTLFVGMGTISGSDGEINPTDTTTRAEMAQVLCNLMSKL